MPDRRLAEAGGRPGAGPAWKTNHQPPSVGRAGRQRLTLTSGGLPGSGFAVRGVKPPDGRPVSRSDTLRPQKVIHRLLAPGACGGAKGDLPSDRPRAPPHPPRRRGRGGEGVRGGGRPVPAAQLLPCASFAISSPRPAPLRRAERRRLPGRAPQGGGQRGPSPPAAGSEGGGKRFRRKRKQRGSGAGAAPPRPPLTRGCQENPQNAVKTDTDTSTRKL